MKAFAVARSSEVGIGLGSVATAVAIAAGSSVCYYGMLVGSSWGAKWVLRRWYVAIVKNEF